jgi:hypothetical protein
MKEHATLAFGGRSTKGILTMAVHKTILEWQAAHPTITWIFWIMVWVIVFVLLFRPGATGAI